MATVLRILCSTIFINFFMMTAMASEAWLSKALKLQGEIDRNVPLRHATFIGTHNSYNSKAYQIPLVRYLDPNQSLSLYEQLEAGVRSLELDVHWTLGTKFRKEMLLCHGQPNHIGCSPFDRPLKQGLQEIRDWLALNPNEIVLLYIERHVNRKDRKLIQQLEEYLGRFIYRTSFANKTGPCFALPTNLTKSDIRKANKQLLIVTKNCEGLDNDWNDLIFTGIGEIESIPFSFIDTTITYFEPYPECSRNTIFSPDKLHSSLWRIYEDRTFLGSIEHPQKKLYAAEMQQLIRCGINWPTMDGLIRDDFRLYAAIWSWAVAYPQGAGNCAYYQNQAGIKNQSCFNRQPGFSCANADHKFRVASVAGNWQDGDYLCQTTFGKEYHFAMPINGSELDQLTSQMQSLGLNSIWLNYAIDLQGSWQANLKRENASLS